MFFIIPIIIPIVFVVSFVIISLSIVKSAAKHKDFTDTIHTTIKNTINQEGIEKPAEKKRYCEYCGSEVQAGSKQCSACGAKITKN